MGYMGQHHKQERANREMRKNRTNMFQNDKTNDTTIGKRSDRPEVELSDEQKRDVENWSEDYNKKRSFNKVILFTVAAVLTAIAVYFIL